MSYPSAHGYLGLIQELLTCERDEVTKILRSCSNLWSEDLVHALKQMADLLGVCGAIKAGSRLENVAHWLSLEIGNHMACRVDGTWINANEQIFPQGVINGRSPVCEEWFQGVSEKVLIFEEVNQKFNINKLEKPQTEGQRNNCCPECFEAEKTLGIDVSRLMGDLSRIKGKRGLTQTEQQDLCLSLTGYSATDIAFKEYEVLLCGREREEVLESLKQDIDRKADQIRVRMSKTVNAYINHLMDESGPRKSWARIIFWLRSNGYSQDFPTIEACNQDCYASNVAVCHRSVPRR